MSTSAAGEVLTLKEISERHPNLWVAVVVTKRDGNRQPIAGRVVANDVDRYRLRDAIIQYKEICILFTGDSPFPLLL